MPRTNRTMLEDIEDDFQLSQHFQPHYPQQFFEYNLADFNLPSAEYLLDATLKTEQFIGGTQGWRHKGTESTTYRGFSLTYNPVIGPDPFTTLGDPRLSQTFSRTEGTGGIQELKNSYYDTYAFSRLMPWVEENYKELIDRLACQMTRARVAYIDPVDTTIHDFKMHKDEFIFQNLRINIPLQTDPAYVLEIDGVDEYGNYLKLEKHLEIGKMYIWNTRIPHRVYAKTTPKSTLPRIHMVLGLMPWIRVDGDTYWKNEFFGVHPFEMLKQGLLFK